LERDIEAVKDDVRDGLISLESARKDYGVIIDPKTFEVDQLETESLREKRRERNDESR